MSTHSISTEDRHPVLAGVLAVAPGIVGFARVAVVVQVEPTIDTGVARNGIDVRILDRMAIALWL